MPSIEVVVPNYQYGRFLQGCIESVLSQDVENLRVTVIDNASTDNSLAVANELAARDGRIRVIAHPVNVGVVASFNEGIDVAEADYFMILCSDDILVPGSLKRAVSILEKHPTLTVAQGPARIVGAEDIRSCDLDAAQPSAWTILSGPDYVERVCRRPMRRSVGFIVVRTAAQKRAGHYDRNLPFTCDLEMLMRLAALGGVAETNAVQGIRREHKGNISSAYWQDFRLRVEAVSAAIETFLAAGGMGRKQTGRLRALARVSLASDAYWSAVSHLVRARHREAAGLFGFAFGLLPRLTIFPPVGHLFRTKGILSRVRRIFVEVSGWN